MLPVPPGCLARTVVRRWAMRSRRAAPVCPKQTETFAENGERDSNQDRAAARCARRTAEASGGAKRVPGFAALPRSASRCNGSQARVGLFPVEGARCAGLDHGTAKAHVVLLRANVEVRRDRRRAALAARAHHRQRRRAAVRLAVGPRLDRGVRSNTVQYEKFVDNPFPSRLRMRTDDGENP